MILKNHSLLTSKKLGLEIYKPATLHVSISLIDTGFFISHKNTN